MRRDWGARLRARRGWGAGVGRAGTGRIIVRFIQLR